MESIIAALINVGFGGCVVAALIWFLRHLVAVTIPEMQKEFTGALSLERTDRNAIRVALSGDLGGRIELLRQQHDEDYSAIAERLMLTEAAVQQILIAGCGRGPFPPSLEHPLPPGGFRAHGNTSSPEQSKPDLAS